MKNNFKNLILHLSKGMMCIFIILLFHNSLSCQTIDTTAWTFTSNQTDGRFTLLTNRNTYLGKSAGSVNIPISFDISSIDTSKWSFLPSGVDGTFRQATNKTTFYGKSANTVVANLVFNVNGSSISDTTLAKVFKSQSGAVRISDHGNLNYINFDNSDNSGNISIVSYNDPNSTLTLTNNAQMIYGNAVDGHPELNAHSGNTNAVSYSFVGDPNSGLNWNSQDVISLVAGGADRVIVKTTEVAFAIPLKVVNLTQTQIDALTPSTGMIVYNTDAVKMQYFNGSSWIQW